MDFKQRPPSPGELRRFFERFGEQKLIDRESKRFKELGLQVAHYGDQRWLEIACSEPMVLKLPLCRYGKHLSVGLAEESWADWARA